MNRKIPAGLAALMLGVGFAGACGGDDSSNEGQLAPEGGETQMETSPGVTQSPTDTTPQETVTQPETGP